MRAPGLTPRSRRRAPETEEARSCDNLAAMNRQLLATLRHPLFAATAATGLPGGA